MGDCFRHLGKVKKSEQFYRHYLDLLLLGAEGSYSMELVGEGIRHLHDRRGQTANGNKIQEALHAALKSTEASFK
jgi:hypothetical protein